MPRIWSAQGSARGVRFSASPTAGTLSGKLLADFFSLARDYRNVLLATWPLPGLILTSMTGSREAVITGVGVVSPIGIGREAFWHSLLERRSGVKSLPAFVDSGLAVQFGAEITDFDPKEYVTPRKSLKVMSRNIQLGFTAAELARQDAAFQPGSADPERFGVILGSDPIYLEPEELIEAYRSCVVDGQFRFDQWGPRALGEMYPLWMLKYLPNMPACHIAIAQDARGPNNTITLSEVSSLLAIAEAMRVIERGHADILIAGGTGSRIHPLSWVFRTGEYISGRMSDPQAASRPFDADRDGMVCGEGAAALVMESREHAEARGARILARVVSYASTFEAPSNRPATGRAIMSGIRQAMASAQLTPDKLSHVNAHGVSTVQDDAVEAGAIREALGGVPVTAPKSFFGNLGAGTGAVEAVASILALASGEVPATLNYERPDPNCPIEVIHGSSYHSDQKAALLLNQASTGQSVALVIEAA